MKREKENFLVRKLNQLRLSSKLFLMQIFCVIIPLLATDSVVIHMLISAEQREKQQEINNIADSVSYTIIDSAETAMNLMQNIYSNQYVNDFIEREYLSPLDYYNRYTKFIKDSLFSVSIDNNYYKMILYADNPGVVNGGYFQRAEMVENSNWYQRLMDSEKDMISGTAYEKVTWQNQRCFYLARKMNHGKKKQDGSVMRLDINYARFQQNLMKSHYSSTVYVTEGSKIIFSNTGKGGPYAPFESMRETDRQMAGAHKIVNIYGTIWDIYVMPQEITYEETFVRNMPLLLGLLFLNVFFPYTLMKLLNVSFTGRLKEMDEVFSHVGKGEIYPIPEVRGKDEISELMESYNEMANRVNELIETEYKNRLKRQEMNIARQKAELLALHSQINPHFLFNALESIRMHSIIKKEYETADMVQKLALMQRQNVEWGNDSVQIKDEIRFIEAYLELQKYRFGEKLKYEIQVDEDCEAYRIPKLTLVTFVENACIHGLESKTTNGWVFVRVYKKEQILVLEIEDTGSGMPEETCRQFVEGMNNVNIEKLQETHSIGIYNAALRLKMFSKDSVRFEMESEEGVGTLVIIHIPLENAEKMRLQ